MAVHRLTAEQDRRPEALSVIHLAVADLVLTSAVAAVQVLVVNGRLPTHDAAIHTVLADCGGIHLPPALCHWRIGCTSARGDACMDIATKQVLPRAFGLRLAGRVVDVDLGE
jgi:hypothetical protein